MLLAENGDAPGPVIEHSVLPEALVIVVVFVLYSAWDFVGFRLFRDPLYAAWLETPGDSEITPGPRRVVTFV